MYIMLCISMFVDKTFQKSIKIRNFSKIAKFAQKSLSASLGQAIFQKPIKKLFFSKFFLSILFNILNNEHLEDFKLIGENLTKL